MAGYKEFSKAFHPVDPRSELCCRGDDEVLFFRKACNDSRKTVDAATMPDYLHLFFVLKLHITHVPPVCVILKDGFEHQLLRLRREQLVGIERLVPEVKVFDS